MAKLLHLVGTAQQAPALAHAHSFSKGAQVPRPSQGANEVSPRAALCWSSGLSVLLHRSSPSAQIKSKTGGCSCEEKALQPLPLQSSTLHPLHGPENSPPPNVSLMGSFQTLPASPCSQTGSMGFPPGPPAPLGMGCSGPTQGQSHREDGLQWDTGGHGVIMPPSSPQKQ